MTTITPVEPGTALEYHQAWGLSDFSHAVHRNAPLAARGEVLGAQYDSVCGYRCVLTDENNHHVDDVAFAPLYLRRAYRCKKCDTALGVLGVKPRRELLDELELFWAQVRAERTARLEHDDDGGF